MTLPIASALYVGPATPYNTSYSRMVGLRELSQHYVVFDQDRILSDVGRSRLARWWEKAFSGGPRIQAANEDLLRHVARERPRLVWIDKGEWILPSTVRMIRGTGARIVLHTTDNLWPRHFRSYLVRRNTRRMLPLSDAFFTTNVDDHRVLNQATETKVFLTDLGYDDTWITPEPLPPDELARYSTDFVFAGRWEPHREEAMLALARAGFRVALYGPEWHRGRARAEIKALHRGRPSDTEYVCAIKGATIAMCFVSHLNNAPSAARLFEITGAGVFLLAERTAVQERYFVEGKEAEFFGDPIEMMRKARYYMTDVAARRAVAAAGYARCTTSDYSWRSIMRRDVNRLLPLWA